jgi:AcrR family transcriptional regulator
MGVKERKQREKEEFRNLVINTANSLIKEAGLNAFSMRKLADRLEFSVSKLYLFFENKDKIILEICDQICKRLLTELKEVPQFRDKEKYLLALTRANIDFYRNEQGAVEVVIYTCYGPEGLTPPESYRQLGAFFAQAVKELNFPSLQNEEQIKEALNAFRFLLVGITHMLSVETPEKGCMKLAKSMEKSLRILICGWKHMQETDR